MSHFSGAVIWEERDGEIYLLIQEFETTNPRFRIKRGKKFPGGRSKIGESPEQTLRRELNEELRVCVSGEMVQIAVVSSNRNHTMYFFLIQISQLEGDIWNEVVDDGQSKIQPLVSVRANKVGSLPGFLDSHQTALLVTLRHFGLVG